MFYPLDQDSAKEAELGIIVSADRAWADTLTLIKEFNKLYTEKYRLENDSNAKALKNGAQMRAFWIFGDTVHGINTCEPYEKNIPLTLLFSPVNTLQPQNSFPRKWSQILQRPLVKLNLIWIITQSCVSLERQPLLTP